MPALQSVDDTLSPFLFLPRMMRKLRLMKRFIMLSVAVLVVSISAFAQRDRLPTFRQYPAKVERATARSIDFRNSDPGARSFRTRLTDGLRRGVNFAGRYILVGWGCGTGCSSAAVIDGRTGRVYFPKQIGGIATGIANGDYVEESVRYRKNSRLLIISGVPEAQLDGPELPDRDYYYEWRNNGLRLIRSVPRRTN